MGKEIIEAIKKDDLKKFESQMKNKDDFALCFGKYPILTLCYLFHSRKILRKYEKILITIGEYRVVEGYSEPDKEFRKKAKKCIRFFTDDDIIDPIVMLAVLEDSDRLEKYFPIAKKTKKDIALIPKIYELLHYKIAKRNGNELILPAKSLTKPQKATVLTGIAVTFVIIAIAVAAPIILIDGYGEGNAANPYKVYTEEQFFEALVSDKNIVLMSDIAITENTEIKKFSARLDGNGKTLKISPNINNRLITELTGEIDNLNIDFGDISRILTDSDSLFIYKNSGSLTNISVNINGSFKERSSEINHLFAILSLTNFGTIANCSIKGKISFEGDGKNNAYFGGFAGLNYGEVQNCDLALGTVIEADTMDIAGIVIENEEQGLIKDCVNFANLTQTSSAPKWSPNVSGIVYNNLGKVVGCSNFGNINVSTSNVDAEITNNIVIAGIAYQNIGSISNCENNGTLTVFSNENDVNTIALVAGITVNNGGNFKKCVIEKCKNNGDLIIAIRNKGAIAAGIAAYNKQGASVTDCGSTAKIISMIEDKSGNEVAIGGIAGSSVGKIENCFSYAVTDYVGGSLTANYIGGILAVGYSNDTDMEINNYYVKRDNIELGVAARQQIVEGKPEIVRGDNIGVNIVDSLEELEKTEVFW